MAAAAGSQLATHCARYALETEGVVFPSTSFSNDDHQDLSRTAPAEPSPAPLERYFRALTPWRSLIGSLAADGLLEFFLKDIGPLAYNAAVADVRLDRLQARVMEVDAEVYEEAFGYWGSPDSVIRRKLAQN